MGNDIKNMRVSNTETFIQAHELSFTKIDNYH